jgi:hypothetical protein
MFLIVNMLKIHKNNQAKPFGAFLSQEKRGFEKQTLVS